MLALYQFFRLLLWHSRNLKHICQMSNDNLSKYLGDPETPLQPHEIINVRFPFPFENLHIMSVCVFTFD